MLQDIIALNKLYPSHKLKRSLTKLLTVTVKDLEATESSSETLYCFFEENDNSNKVNKRKYVLISLHLYMF